jgi:hypothetical protein
MDMTGFDKRLPILLGVLVAASPAWSQSVRTLADEYQKQITSAEVVSALGTDLFGDTTNYYTGGTTFSVTDVSLAGNNALPVNVGRRFVVQDRGALYTEGLFADWELDIPHLHGVFPAWSGNGIGWQSSVFQGPDRRCSVNSIQDAAPPEVAGRQGGIFSAPEYWHGNSLYVPGQGDQEMLLVSSANPSKPAGGPYYWVTNNQWFFSCLDSTANAVPGEGFLARAPDGTRYWFNWFSKRKATIIKKPYTDGPLFAPAQGEVDGGVQGNVMAMAGTTTQLYREEVWILPTRVEDRFGNWVTYVYDFVNPARLTGIASSDGRAIAIAYNPDGKISSVTAGGRTWTYSYTGGLSMVSLPDGSAWQYALSSVMGAQVRARTVSENPPPSCTAPASSSTQQTYTGRIIHPSGAIGDFVFRSTLHGRSYVPKQCMYPGGAGADSSYAYAASYFDTVALQSKTISGPGINAPYQWTFIYGPPNASWASDCANSTCSSTKQVEAIGPGDYVRYTFGNRHLENEGKLLKVESGESPGQVLRTETTAYQFNATGQPYPAKVGSALFFRGDHGGERLAPVLLRQTLQQGVVMTYAVNGFDVHARPISVTRSSAPAP